MPDGFARLVDELGEEVFGLKWLMARPYVAAWLDANPQTVEWVRHRLRTLAAEGDL